MSERLDDVWASRDYPVLREVTRRIDAGLRPMNDTTIAEAVGIDQPTAYLAAKALERRGLVELAEGYALSVDFLDVAGAAYLITGLHPDGDDALSSLMQMLRDAADQEVDEDERGRLRRAADAIGGVSRGVMTGVLTAYLTGQIQH